MLLGSLTNSGLPPVHPDDEIVFSLSPTSSAGSEAQRLIAVFDEFTMKNKTHILPAYNCEYVFSAFNFMLLFSLRLFDN